MVEVNSFNNGFEMCFNSNALVVYRRARRRRRRRRAKGNKTKNKKKNENEIRTQKLCLQYIFILLFLLNWKTNHLQATTAEATAAPVQQRHQQRLFTWLHFAPAFLFSIHVFKMLLYSIARRQINFIWTENNAIVLGRQLIKRKLQLPHNSISIETWKTIGDAHTIHFCICYAAVVSHVDRRKHFSHTKHANETIFGAAFSTVNSFVFEMQLKSIIS